jgi:hypothetical protein
VRFSKRRFTTSPDIKTAGRHGGTVGQKITRHDGWNAQIGETTPHNTAGKKAKYRIAVTDCSVCTGNLVNHVGF